jgi:hypothetical protein
MRVTLDIDDDVLAAAEHLASRQKSSAGQVISDLARTALVLPPAPQATFENGVWVLPRRGGVVTPELVERLAEGEA